MVIDFSQLAEGESYFTLIQLVVPRPIAWILSSNQDGSLNLAPFSFFNAVCGEPPIVAIGIGRRPDGSLKDTQRNLEERPLFVLHLPSVANGPDMVRSSAALPPLVSEVEAGGIELEDVPAWPLPRIRKARAALLCRRDRILELGDGPTGVVLAEVTQAWVDPSAVSTSNGRRSINPEALDPLSRLGGTLYSRLGAIESHPRP